ncbi:MAG: hypothetical protein FWD92_05865 [Methanomassiliicoccaceae archaeon]|nr:hypothetical protein [Methanomassiliicoccaceae archaeon]
MWDLARGRMFFMVGAALAFIGMGIITLGHTISGIILFTVGVFLIIVGLSILRLHLSAGLRKK